METGSQVRSYTFSKTDAMAVTSAYGPQEMHIIESVQQKSATEAVGILLQVTNLQCMVSAVKNPELRMPLPLSL